MARNEEGSLDDRVREGKKRAKRVTKQVACRKYLLANPRASNAEAVKACQISPRLVTTVRAELRAAGLIPPAFGDWTSARPPAPPDATSVGSPAEQALLMGSIEFMEKAAKEQADAGHEFSLEDQLRLCRRFANSSQESAQVRLAALVTYNKIKSDRKSVV